jgi:hypothetical protein
MECIARDVPIEPQEYPKRVASYIWEISLGLFVFSDETENFSDNIYCSIEEAQAALNAYGEWLNQEPEGECND